MSICPDCNGTGADAKKTKAARKAGTIDAPSYIRCWSCNGNGNDTASDFFDARSRKPMVLSQAQAEAVYSAMCALNNVGGQIDALMPAGGGTGARVRETANGSILVAGEFRGEAHGGPWKEIYADQSAFATAYGLQQR